MVSWQVRLPERPWERDLTAPHAGVADPTSFAYMIQADLCDPRRIQIENGNCDPTSPVSAAAHRDFTASAQPER